MMINAWNLELSLHKDYSLKKMFDWSLGRTAVFLPHNKELKIKIKKKRALRNNSNCEDYITGTWATGQTLEFQHV